MFEVKSGYPIYELSHKLAESPDPGDYSRHMHSCCELLLFVRGDASFNLDGILYEPKPYDLLIIPKAIYHFLIPKSTAPYENYVLDFSSNLIPKEHVRRLFARPWITNIKHDGELCHFFHLLDAYHEAYTAEDFAICAKALLRELLIFCSYRMEKSVVVEAERNPLVQTMLSLIDEHLEKPINAEFLAKEMMLSKSYVQNVFSQSMHIGLKQYITQKKMFAAEGDLASGMSSGDVAAKYGFEDYSVFFRLYKKTMGISPAESKRRQEGE